MSIYLKVASLNPHFNLIYHVTQLIIKLDNACGSAETWDEGYNCYNETQPIWKEEYWGIYTDREMMKVAESILENMEKRGLNIQYLNITKLSDYRKDAHPSIYRKFPYPITEEKQANPTTYSDCVHWCLPGVPDIWNEILYYYIMAS